ncbi:MAG: hypothetical protein FWF50_03265 [Defluviitaleaceae bacterium]|nr:hypothetical protein [Defluviitaleaceae bacterium]
MKKLLFLSSLIFIASCTRAEEDSYYNDEYYTMQNSENTALEQPEENDYGNIEDLNDENFNLAFPPSAWPQRGTWAGSIYTNEYLGIKFTMPENWESWSDEEIASNIGTGIEFIEGIESVEEIMRTAEITSFMELMAMNPETAANISIAFQVLEDPNMSALDFINYSANIASDVIEVFVDGFPNIILGNTSWNVYETAVDLPGARMYARHLVSVQSGFVRMINLAHIYSSETAEELLQLLSELF